MDIITEHSKIVKLFSFTHGETAPTSGPLVNVLVCKLCDINEELFKNPKSTFLDPTAGTGGIVIGLLKKLLNYHTKEHILNNMIFVNDNSKVNCDVLRHLGFKNIYNEDIMSDKINKKFTCVVLNSPYQSNTSDKNSANALWVKINQKVTELVEDDGYIATIHPDSWLNYSETYSDYNKGRMTTRLYRARVLSIVKPLFIWVGKKIGSEYFSNIGVDFSVIISKKTNEELPIIFKHNDNEIVLPKLGKRLIPKTSDINVINLFNKLFNDNDDFVKILSNNSSSFVSDTRKWTHISKTMDNVHTYPLCNTSAQYNVGQYLWSSIPHEYQNVSKVIFSDSGYSRPFYDVGNYGLSSHSFGIPCDGNIADKIVFFLNSNVLDKIISFMASSGAESKLSVIKNMIPNINFEKLNIGCENSIINCLSEKYKLNDNEKNIFKNE
jgi:hypothetical protein